MTNRIYRIIWVVLTLMLLIIEIFFLPRIFFELARSLPLLVITYIFIIEKRDFFSYNKQFNFLASIISVLLAFSQISNYLSTLVRQPWNSVLSVITVAIYISIVHFFISLSAKKK
ncbi:hypothetical protein BDE36_3515 [Arcticibacter tournemirensis]|nr:hypothetical protein BDE36_3515 [Arcticibacter tournemirensis]